MGELRWIKVATDLFENRKIRYLLRQPDGEKMVLMWIRLLCFAGRINDRGRVYFTEELPLDAATLAADLLEESGLPDIRPERLQSSPGSLMVTPRDIDQQVRDLGKVIGYGINWALQDLEIEEINALLS